MFEAVELVRDFLGAGGNVLLIIFATTLLLWTFILERFIFFRWTFPEMYKLVESKWNQRSDKSSWAAHRIREAEISKLSMTLNRFIPLIKTLVALCPLLGLLGTVTGMIAVFDVMAVTGTGNARMMAGGISMATIPTMAGMVAAISGLYFSSRIENRAKFESQLMADQLSTDHLSTDRFSADHLSTY